MKPYNLSQHSKHKLTGHNARLDVDAEVQRVQGIDQRSLPQLHPPKQLFGVLSREEHLQGGEGFRAQLQLLHGGVTAQLGSWHRSSGCAEA